MKVIGLIINVMEEVDFCLNSGVFYFINGEKYDGEWKDSQMNGKGLLFIHIRCLLLSQ